MESCTRESDLFFNTVFLSKEIAIFSHNTYSVICRQQTKNEGNLNKLKTSLYEVTCLLCNVVVLSRFNQCKKRFDIQLVFAGKTSIEFNTSCCLSI